MRRAILLAAALAIPVSGASVALVSGGQAWASTTITCTSVTGSTSSGDIDLSGCNGNTGGTTGSIPFGTLATGGTVAFTGTPPDQFTFSAPHISTPSAKKCPGYVKKAKSNPSLAKFKGTVTAQSGLGIKAPKGKFAGEVCISNDMAGTITNLGNVTIS